MNIILVKLWKLLKLWKLFLSNCENYSSCENHNLLKIVRCNIKNWENYSKIIQVVTLKLWNISILEIFPKSHNGKIPKC